MYKLLNGLLAPCDNKTEVTKRTAKNALHLSFFLRARKIELMTSNVATTMK